MLSLWPLSRGNLLCPPPPRRYIGPGAAILIELVRGCPPLRPYGAAPARATPRQPAKARHTHQIPGPARRRQRLPAALAQVGRAPHRRRGRGLRAARPRLVARRSARVSNNSRGLAASDKSYAVRDVGKARPVGGSCRPSRSLTMSKHRTVEVWFVRHGETVATRRASPRASSLVG